ncbi:MAG: hypothetical protein A3B25_02015 [Candidatus Ryanbacteria bacterium RIFCSPLOWO2_01_FULL_48_26]|uniref:Uncharacterized protein n=1 Tax=Candidatus Ryanbacteria bacterium RIFCSPLOWO2_01_FULL_48_26 TaxID=1802126 RepID=A0A1G2GSZ5_9BACT|nr:MAG: hypothetical protein A3B25_02015 [Candidatus Ryanbacteria bacterium RIFCSPLOWO2_01_FULL_48_26]
MKIQLPRWRTPPAQRLNQIRTLQQMRTAALQPARILARDRIHWKVLPRVPQQELRIILLQALQTFQKSELRMIQIPPQPPLLRTRD